jgi:DNA-binding MarR family transcriptional regulator
MIDDSDFLKVPLNNYRTLFYMLDQACGERLASFRQSTIYKSVRASEIRVFVVAAQKPQSISDIARLLKISRQAAQSSVQRLLKLNVLALQSPPGNKREKLVVITPKGELAQKSALMQIKRLEGELAEVIGFERMEQMRQDLSIMLQLMRARNDAENVQV